MIRSELPDDLHAIRAVTIDAFSQSEFGYQGEAELVDQLRIEPDSLSLVACRDGVLIGHALWTPVVIQGDGQTLEGMGLGPVSVATDCQRQGVGAQLIQSGLDRLAREGCPFVVVLGHPEYYSRFGFVPAADWGISHGFAGIPQHVFFVHWLASEPVQIGRVGRAYYRPAFGPQHDGD
ncbi:MAG: N-acetyltransferase [Pirellulales bacterium]